MVDKMQKKLEVLQPQWLAVWFFIIILGAASFPYGVEIWIIGVVVAFILFSERNMRSGDTEETKKDSREIKE